MTAQAWPLTPLHVIKIAAVAAVFATPHFISVWSISADSCSHAT